MGVMGQEVRSEEITIQEKVMDQYMKRHEPEDREILQVKSIGY